MGHVTVGNENGTPVELHDEDHSAGRPVVLLRTHADDGDAALRTFLLRG